MRNSFSFRVHDLSTPQRKVEVSFYECLPLSEAGFINAFSTRGGGVSPFPNDALNMGNKDDTPENIAENRRRFLKALGTPSWALHTMQQSHSNVVAILPSQPTGQEAPADALVSKMDGVLLGVKTADCVPILVGDPITGSIGAIHAGWRGVLGGIVKDTLILLRDQLRVDPQKCLVAVGPFICPRCYEIGEEVAELFRKAYPRSGALVSSSMSPAKTCLDLSSVLRIQFNQAGIKEDRVFFSGFCTVHNNDLFFSYRKESFSGHRPVGRLLSVVGRRSHQNP